jgi:glycosyltransferase involved in cell wall biosynthesis
VCADTGASFAVVGTGKAVGQAVGFDHDPPGTGWLELADYPKAMAGFDIGIVPLDDIAFNHAKSALKVLEFAAVGVPTIASPTPDNVRMAMHGACLLAGRRREWNRELRRLATSPGLRAELGGRAREAMAAHTIQANIDQWWDAWTAPLTTRRTAP